MIRKVLFSFRDLVRMPDIIEYDLECGHTIKMKAPGEERWPGRMYCPKCKAGSPSRARH